MFFPTDHDPIGSHATDRAPGEPDGEAAEREQEEADTADTCPDCMGDTCRCAEWEEAERQADIAEAESGLIRAETQIPELWYTGSDGLLRRRPT